MVLSARTGKTIGLIDGWITYSIICDPSDFLLVQLTQEKASEHSRKRLDRTFRCSPGKDIVDIKHIPKSTHEAPPTTGILSLYNRGDRRRFYWQCPDCSEYFEPSMANMVGYREDSDFVKASENARLQCPHCQTLIAPELKRELNIKGVWLKEGQKIDASGQISGESRKSRIASFWLEGPAAAYQTWAQLTYKLLNAEHEYEMTGSEETLKAVTNTDWGLPYLPRSALEQRRADELMERREEVEEKTVPPQCRFIVAAVDVQGGKNRRFVVQMVGYGENGERWLIDRYNISHTLPDSDGVIEKIDPRIPDDWQILITDVLEKRYLLAHNPNHFMPILAMAVDSGGEEGVTDNAYKFWL